jgi:hypothetical protein
MTDKTLPDSESVRHPAGLLTYESRFRAATVLLDEQQRQLDEARDRITKLEEALKAYLEADAAPDIERNSRLGAARRIAARALTEGK